MGKPSPRAFRDLGLKHVRTTNTRQRRPHQHDGAIRRILVTPRYKRHSTDPRYASRQAIAIESVASVNFSGSE